MTTHHSTTKVRIVLSLSSKYTNTSKAFVMLNSRKTDCFCCCAPRNASEIRRSLCKMHQCISLFCLVYVNLRRGIIIKGNLLNIVVIFAYFSFISAYFSRGKLLKLVRFIWNCSDLFYKERDRQLIHSFWIVLFFKTHTLLFSFTGIFIEVMS